MVKRVVFDLLATGWDWDENRWAGASPDKRRADPDIELEQLLSLQAVKTDVTAAEADLEEKSFINARFGVVYVC